MEPCVILDPRPDGTYRIAVKPGHDCRWTRTEELAFLRSETFRNSPAVKRAWGTFPTGKEYLDQRFETLCHEYPWLGVLLRHGREYMPVEGIAFESESEGRCFAVSFGVARYSRGRETSVDYVEGIGVGLDGVAHHAWNHVKERVFDATWPIPNLTRYFGVVFELDWMQETFQEQGDISVFRRWKTHQRHIEAYLENRSKGRIVPWG